MTIQQAKRGITAGALGLALSVGGSVLWAHHPIAGKFDLSKKMELTGVVTKVDWRNPHAHLMINVMQGGKLMNWAVELESPTLLEMNGWSQEVVGPGDKIEVKGGQARNGSRQIWGEEVRMSGSGRLLFTPKMKASKSPLDPRPTPKGPDGHPILGWMPGLAEGYWTDPTKTAMVEDGVNVAMDQYGQLASVADASKVAPLQPWALALYQNRQNRQLRDDPLFINCKPPGGPRQYQSVLGFQFVEDRVHQRLFILMGSGNRNYRIIYMDGRDQVGSVRGDDDNPLYYGRSTGKWEGDTLVVKTTGFNEDFWFTNGGLPHTTQLVLTERFTRPNNEKLHYEVEVDDMGAYTRKWKSSWDLTWNGGQDLPSHFCQSNRP